MKSDRNTNLVNNVPPSLTPPNKYGQYNGNYGGYGRTDYGMYGPDFAQSVASSIDYEEPLGSSNVSETLPLSSVINYGENYNREGDYMREMKQNPQYSEYTGMGKMNRMNSVMSNTMVGTGVSYSGSSMSGMGTSRVEIVPPPPQPKSRSRIQYIPIQKTVIDYQTNQWIETVPRQKTITQYQQRRWTEQVPREVTKTNYYAVQHVREFVPQIVSSKQVEMIPQERIIQRTDYIPVQRQINYGLQGTSRVSEGRVMGYGQAIKHEVIPMGVTQGQTTIMRGQASIPEVVGVRPGSGYYQSNYSSGVRYNSPGRELGRSGYQYNQTTRTASFNNGYNSGYGNGYGNAYYQTPGIVTNVNLDGSIVQTPVVITNKL